MAKNIPIQPSGLILKAEDAKAYGASQHASYVNADPFPHIMIDNFLPDDLAETILSNFPDKPVDKEVNFNMGYAGQFKRQIPPAHCNEYNRNLFAFFNSEPMLQFLESITGIEKLIPDPYFTGGGYHEISAGGLLGIHADFRVNKQLNLNRRINMLIYLNKNWQEEWGGCLELWDKSMTDAQKSIYPIFNRCVIFNTDQDSFHGHPDPLACPDNVTRKSIALYYYTASEKVLEEIPAHDTMYQARPKDGAALKYETFTLRLDNYLADLMPPVMYRVMRRVKGKLFG